MADDIDRGWQRARECESTTCVEVRFDGPDVLVRSSQDPQGPQLRFDRDEWRVFCAAVAAGEFAG